MIPLNHVVFYSLKCYLLYIIQCVENFILNNFLLQMSNKKSRCYANKLNLFINIDKLMALNAITFMKPYINFGDR